MALTIVRTRCSRVRMNNSVFACAKVQTSGIVNGPKMGGRDATPRGGGGGGGINGAPQTEQNLALRRLPLPQTRQTKPGGKGTDTAGGALGIRIEAGDSA